MRSRVVRQTLIVFCVWTVSNVAISQDEAATAASLPQASIIDFARDIRPILESKCLECHGPDEAKNDFRVDDSETMLAYLEPGDLESSSLWTDYLTTDDPDMLMPPPGPDGKNRLTGVQLATIKLWIEEGAVWPEELPSESEVVTEVSQPLSLAERIWSFQGLFHPASVHFPVALLSVSAGFVFLSFFNRDSFEAAAFHCLWIGAIGAIASCAMGWAYAEHEGYGAGYSLDLANSSIDRHRWLGIGVAIIAVVLIPMARSVRRNGDLGMRVIWFIGSLLMVGAVSTTGYQGGELTYGEDHYAKEFERLFPTVSEPATAESTAEEEALTSEMPADETLGEESTADVPEPSSPTPSDTNNEPSAATERPSASEGPSSDGEPQTPKTDAPDTTSGA